MFFSKSSLQFLLIVMMALDAVLTIMGQPDPYWEDHTQCNELNPVGIATLSAHPYCFIGLYGVWFLAILFAATRLPYLVQMMVILAALGGHTWGTSTWIYGLLYWQCDWWIEHLHFRLMFYIPVALFAVLCAVRIHKERQIMLLLTEE